MKKFVVLGLGLVVLFGVFYFAGKLGYTTREEDIGREVIIDYSQVNVRETPNGEVIGKLGLYDEVTLTGKRCDLSDGPSNRVSWVEIQYEGDTAWVTHSAIKW